MSEELKAQFSTLLAKPWVPKVIWILVAAVVIWLVAFLIRKSLKRYVQDNAGRYKSRKIVNFAAFAVLGISVAVILSDKLGGIGVTLGVASAGIAFALQEVIVSFAGWIAILTGNFFKVGERVELGGVKGDVIDIGVLRTTIMETGQWVDGDLYNGRMVRVANSFIFKEPVTNYTSDFPFLWDEIKIPVTFKSDLKLVRSEIEKIAQETLGQYSENAREAWKHVVKNYLIEDAEVMPRLTLIANDNWVEFTLRYVVDFKSRRGTKDKLWTQILETMDTHSDKMGMASATFELVQAPKFQVDLRNSSIS